MRHIKCLSVVVTVAAVISCSRLAFGDTPATAAPAADVPTVHVFIAIDEQSELPGLYANRQEINTLLTALCTSGVSTLDPVSIGEISPDNITSAINKLPPVGKSDVVFFYYAGHGGTDKDLAATDEQKGHFLATSHGDLLRSKLLKAINDIKVAGGGANDHPRLRVILTDCCSNGATYVPPSLAAAGTFVGPAVAKRRLIDLFLRHKGVVNINAATWRDGQNGEFAWYISMPITQYGIRNVGGLFTMAFYDAVQSSPDQGNNAFFSWKSLVDQTTKNADTYYNGIKSYADATFRPEVLVRYQLDSQKTQTPWVFGDLAAADQTVPVVAAASRPAGMELGAAFIDAPGQGVVARYNVGEVKSGDLLLGNTDAIRVLLDKVETEGTGVDVPVARAHDQWRKETLRIEPSGK